MNGDTERELTQAERHIVEKSDVMNVDSFNYSNNVQYTEQGNFTVCNIIGIDGTVYAGVSKRRPEDDVSTVAGHNISFMRALDYLLNCCAPNGLIG